ncbi:hypothetical protein D3C77_285130 [compost metagenome]
MPQGFLSHLAPCQAHQGFQAQQGILGGIGMDGTHGTVVAGVHRRQHIQHFNAANLAKQDTVRAHPQGVADQFAGLDLTVPLGIGRAGFQAHHMGMVQLQLGHILDAHKTFMGRDQLTEDIQQRGLAGAGTAADQDVAALGHRQLKKRQDVHVDGAGGQQVGTLEHVLAEFTDRQARPVQRYRRDDRIDPATVGHARIDHRRRLIQAPPQRCKDALHHPLHMMGVDKAQVGLLQHAGPLDKHPVRAVDQNLGDAGVAQQHLQRTEAGQFIDNLLGQALHLVARQGQVQAGNVVTHLLDHELRQGRPRAFQQIAPAVLDGIDDEPVQGTLEPLRIAAQVVPQAAKQLVGAAHFCPQSRLSQLPDGCLLCSERRARRSPRALR